MCVFQLFLISLYVRPGSRAAMADHLSNHGTGQTSGSNETVLLAVVCCNRDVRLDRRQVLLVDVN
jgi:hypothetical protein